MKTQHNDTQHNNTINRALGINEIRHNVAGHYTDCQNAESPYAGCRYAECRGATKACVREDIR